MRESSATRTVMSHHDHRAEAPLRLDVRGLLCPIPILRTAQRMRDLPAGARLEVVGDDPGIVEDMPIWCEETGNRLIGLERDGELVRCVVERGGGRTGSIR
jgi:tRNA 2-thiouridine synthesizing protein A